MSVLISHDSSRLFHHTQNVGARRASSVPWTEVRISSRALLYSGLRGEILRAKLFYLTSEWACANSSVYVCPTMIRIGWRCGDKTTEAMWWHNTSFVILPFDQSIYLSMHASITNAALHSVSPCPSFIVCSTKFRLLGSLCLRVNHFAGLIVLIPLQVSVDMIDTHL